MQLIGKSHVLGELITQAMNGTSAANRCQENMQAESSYDSYFCSLSNLFETAS